MLSYYGWLSAFEEIDHPLLKKHNGRIYVHKSDVIGTTMLSAGDIVSFYLYVDNAGLGAEGCRLEECVHDSGKTRMHGMRADVQEFVPRSSGEYSVALSLSANEPTQISDVFARMTRVFTSVPANSYVQMAGVPSPCTGLTGINSAYFDDADDSSDGGEEGDKESLNDDTDDSSVAGSDIASKASPGFGGAWKLPQYSELSAKMHHAAHSELDDASTAAGLTSDSDRDCSMHLMMPDGSRFRPPPGLEKPPAGVFPPPGLPPPGVWS
jgi:hypothetical protein